MAPVPPYDGLHLIAELHGCTGLDDPVRIEAALRCAAAAAGATLLDCRVHHFGAGHGVTGVALLAESHITIHSWPEHGYAAVDIFLCGRAHDANAALACLVNALAAKRCNSRSIARGFASVEAAESSLSDEDVVPGDGVEPPTP